MSHAGSGGARGGAGRAPAAPSRRRPQQVRSQETVDRILLAADHEIGERGLAGASTTRIAARAGLSVGALYRFFHDRDAIADALAARYLEAVTPAYADAVSQVSSLEDLEAVVGVLVRRAADLQLEHPGYYRLTEELAPERGDSPARVVREHLLDLFTEALRRAGVATPPPELRAVVELCIETVRHTLAHHPAQDPGRAASLAELELMLGAYLSSRLR
ncbi:TetR/AcrR family transcriptional regulator [Nocardioides sp. zg-1308]|uniref:TetR/AcrR family transcriptional regulator n=1 Tax=Nocardioides renjunii TaxID=3095075 RepID=A0ABU5KAD6_9ACTN|nr:MULTISPECIES: TetR/AcrR family transcriptional regulator [unclassified Nocardioides]MDZ5661935.1 TetR/AcrR family transcriptional regulator [Nocardioides sp. S-58]NPD06358.1 TetR/AcrR family transcriptional regulator [Nocardioides sp. zg-1308]WQQ24175.1 TetR/AcrR family transcriptional regulator [Nocardioides sp. S-34]